jgi:broad specificity phosphatase PhoE
MRSSEDGNWDCEVRVMKNVYLVRHGESETNAGDIQYGPTARLTARGHRQAQFIAERCARLPVEIIVSSGFPRADQTAEYIVRKVGKPFEQSALFAERRAPTATLGKSTSDPDYVAYEDGFWNKFGDPSWRHSDAESFEDLNARARDALAYLASRPEQNILVVGHGLFTRILAARAIFGEKLTGSECLMVMQTFRLANTGLSVFEYDPEHARGWKWRIAVWNDQAHLADG